MLGLKSNLKRKQHAPFSEKEKRMIIEDYLQSGLTKQEIWKKYTGKNDHGLLLSWMHRYGYFSDYREKSTIFASKKPMARSQNSPEQSE